MKYIYLKMIFILIIIWMSLVTFLVGRIYRFKDFQMKFNQEQIELNKEQTINAQLQSEFNSKIVDLFD